MADLASRPDQSDSERSHLIVQDLIAVVFLGLVVWFLWGPNLAAVPLEPAVEVDRALLSTEALRHIQTDRPIVRMGGFDLNCMECHGLFESAEETRLPLTQHRDIALDHGLNDRCFNCHDRKNRNRLALRGGRTIPYSEVARLCAKCHGPTYRDWQQGTHGRTMGSWDQADPSMRRLRCSECHDPHAPAYDPLRPLPGPRTLRMGPGLPEHAGDPVERIDPLRKWRHSHAEPLPSGEGEKHPPASGGHEQ
jgi:hypothetical protein